METIHCDNVEALRHQIETFNEDALFRGQSRHYETHGGVPNLTSSFARKGCIPPRMRKWHFYASELLRVWNVADHDVDWVQALLQHYGWRSFYVDLTQKPSVAAWFASHNYTSTLELHMCEDCYEHGVLLSHERAKYTESVDEGHLYVLSKSLLKIHGHRVMDLQTVNFPFRARPNVQKGWLAGTLSEEGDTLHPETILAHIIAPSRVLCDFAASDDYTTTESIFPPSNEDLFLNHLLSLPWQLLRLTKPEFPEVFVRALPLPDYDPTFSKMFGPNVAFYREHWVALDRGDADLLKNALFIQFPETGFYVHNETVHLNFSSLVHLLEKYETLVVELERLVALPKQNLQTEYTKGVVMVLREAGVFEVSEFLVEHPGRQVTGFGVNRGLTYSFKDGRIERVVHPEDCRCGNGFRHEHHLHFLNVVNAEISAGRFYSVDPLTIKIDSDIN